MSSSKERRERLQAEKEKRDRLAYIGTLAAGLVHEVRTPLNAIQLNAQLLEEDAESLAPEIRERFTRRSQRVIGQIREVVKTLDEFLTFARPPRLDPVPMDINRFLREVIEFFTPEFEQRNVSVEVDLAEGMYPVVMDRGQLTNVMLNIFRNACEACESNEEALQSDMDSGNVPERCVRICSHELEDSEFIAIDVDDNGIGILPGNEEKIFELFYTTKEKGTGLGLGIVRRIVEEHGGTITATDLPDAGARFTIRLPRGKFLEFREDENS